MTNEEAAKKVNELFDEKMFWDNSVESYNFELTKKHILDSIQENTKLKGELKSEREWRNNTRIELLDRNKEIERIKEDLKNEREWISRFKKIENEFIQENSKLKAEIEQLNLKLERG